MYLAARSRASIDGCVMPKASMNIRAKKRNNFIRVFNLSGRTLTCGREHPSTSLPTSVGFVLKLMFLPIKRPGT
jgi:hypothetical protein